jgi:2-dehydro-3-deoxyphosphogluconate aldolase/(4S)-4-hydroxy-2-oxoglutarate aldolase
MLKQILQQPIIPVVEIDSVGHAEPLAEAVLEGGISILEVVLRTEKAIDAIHVIRKQFPEMLVGAGTVLTSSQADQVIDAGATFGIAPGLNLSVAEKFQLSGISFIPGVMTPTEVETALDNDYSLLKFFPAEAAGGIALLKAMAGPYSGAGVQFCATGGITLDNMNSYLNLPVVSGIGGSWLARPEQIQNQNWSLITEQIATAVKRLGEVG